MIDKLLDIHMNNQIYVKKITKDDYDICYSNEIDDEYFNYALLKETNTDLSKITKNVINDLKKLNRKPVIYSMSPINNKSLNKIYTDAWLALDNLSNFPQYKSDLDISIFKVTEEDKYDFVDAVLKGFSDSDEEDPYSQLSGGYRIAMLKCFDNKNEYKGIGYMAKYNNEIIGTTTVLYKEEYAIMYNVTTKRKYKKHGVFKELLKAVVDDLNDIGIKVLSCQTEKGYYPETIYKKLGFKEIMIGEAYEIKEEEI